MAAAQSSVEKHFRHIILPNCTNISHLALESRSLVAAFPDVSNLILPLQIDLFPYTRGFLNFLFFFFHRKHILLQQLLTPPLHQDCSG